MWLRRLALLLLLFPMLAAAQTASYVTMIGSNANYAGGNMTANFLPPANSSQLDYLKYHFPFTVSGLLNTSGAWDLSLADTSSVLPANSQWRLTMCSAGTFGAPTCYTVITPVTCINNGSCSGTTLDLTSDFAGAPIPPGGGGGGPVNWPALNSLVISNNSNSPLGLAPVNGDCVVGAAGAWTAGSCVTGGLPIGNIGQILVNTSGATTYAAQAGILYSQPGDTITSIEAACSSLCTYVVTIPQTLTLSANHTLSSNVNLMFLNNGSWTVNGPGFTLTIPGNVSGTLTSHFPAGSGSLSFGNSQPFANAEWFGAVGDGATNDAPAIQACLNAVTLGQCVLQGKTYSISTSTLSITKSNVGILGVAGSATNNSVYPTPGASTLLSSSASADIIDCFGTGGTNYLFGNKFQNFTMSRSVVPNGVSNGPPPTGPAGLYLKYSYGAIIDRVVSQDSGFGFFFHGVGSVGIGYVNNSMATWGFNGVSETVGAYMGFYIESQNGDQNPSLRMTNDTAIRNGFGINPNMLGFVLYGVQLNDFMGWNLETAMVNYGEFIQATGVNGIGAQDIHFRNAINDQCSQTCIYISSVVSSETSSVDIDGGWDNSVGGGYPDITVIGSNNVVVRGVQIHPTATTACVTVSTSSNVSISGNNLLCGGAPGISITGGSDYSISGNLINTSSNGIQLLSSAVNASIANNVLSGMTTNPAISIASGSSGISGLETNSFDASVTIPISSAVPFAIAPIQSETVASSATPTFSNITASSTNTLTANVTSFTLAAGVDGQQKTLTFCQNGTGNFTVTPPTNVHGFFTVGTNASTCSTQTFTYSAGQTAWLANSSGVINQ